MACALLVACMRSRDTAKWAIYLTLITLVIGILVVWPSYVSRHGTGVSPVGNPPVGTTGHTAATEAEESPATLHDFETVTGVVDQHELIGRRVDFQAMVADIANGTSFWVGNKDNQILVVLGRDNHLQPVKPGQMARITGTIEAIPNADAPFSWELNDSVRREFKDQKVYIRADNVILTLVPSPQPSNRQRAIRRPHAGLPNRAHAAPRTDEWSRRRVPSAR
jgi:hypothetical protein